jgi:hypothetical protein
MTIMDGFLFGIGFLIATGIVLIMVFALLVAVEPLLGKGD